LCTNFWIDYSATLKPEGKSTKLSTKNLPKYLASPVLCFFGKEVPKPVHINFEQLENLENVCSDIIY
jgi:hypothetical protein